MTAPTTTFQISDKRGDAILLVKTEGIDPDATYQAFGAAVQDAGLDGGLNAFGAGLVQAVANAQPLTVPPVYAAAGQQAAYQAQPEPWGQPPVPQFQPQMPAAAAAAPQQNPAAPTCQHGEKKYITGTGKKPPYSPWAAWGCPAKQGDPTKCDPGLEFIRG